MRTRISLAALAAAAAVPAVAQAETPPARETVVVTASRWPEAAAAAPGSVAVVTAENLSGADSGEDLVRRVAGLQAALANGAQTAFQIRGLGAVDHQALTPGAAAVYVDGVYLATNVQTSQLTYDLDRVEVLKGPQGTLYGRNASSGSIHFLSRRPGDELSATAGLSIGRFNRIDADGAIGGPISDKLSGRIAGRYLREDAALENVGGPEDAGGVRDEFGVRGSLAFDADDATRFTARVHYEEDNGINPAPRNSGLSVGDHQISVGADGLQDTDNEFFGGAFEIAATRGGWTLNALTAIEGYNQQYGFDFDGLPAASANLSYDRDYLQVSQDIDARTDWTFGEALTGRTLVGLSLSADDFSQDYLIWCGVLNAATLAGTCTYPGAPGRVGPSPASTTPAVTLLTHITQAREAAALYTQNDIDLTERLTLTLGARFTSETIEGRGWGRHVYADGRRAFNNRSGLGLAIGENVIEDDHITANAALRYSLTDSAMIYAAYNSGYKSGGFNGEVQNNATHFQDEGLFGAETVDAFETGLKWRLGDTLALDAALFHQDYQDPQARIFVFFPLPGGGSITSNSLANLDSARAYGADVSLDWAPMRGLDISAGLVLLDTEISQGADASGSANAATFNGKPMPFASEVSGTLSVRQEWPLSGERRLAVELSGKAESGYFLDAEGRQDRRQSAYGVLDAALRYHLDARGLELALWGRNLTNSDYAVSGYGFIGYDTFRSHPLAWGVSARVRR